jgi:hypothetical protein
MTHLALDNENQPNDDKEARINALLAILGERTPELFGFALSDPDSRAQLYDALVVGYSSELLASMRGKRVVIVDDSGSVIRQALPLLIGATEGAAQVVWVDKRGLGQDVYSELTPRGLAENILAAKPEWVLMDWELRCGFYGTDVVDQLQRLSPGTPCIGFSSMSSAFDRSPVLTSVYKSEDNMVRSLEGVSKVIAKYAPTPNPVDELPLIDLEAPPNHYRERAPDLLVAISILCQGYLLVHGAPEHHEAIGFNESAKQLLTLEHLPSHASDLISSPKTWSDVLVANDTLARLNNEVLDPVATKSVIQFVSGLCRGDITEIRLETVAAMFQEISIELRD